MEGPPGDSLFEFEPILSGNRMVVVLLGCSVQEQDAAVGGKVSFSMDESMTSGMLLSLPRRTFGEGYSGGGARDDVRCKCQLHVVLFY